jgi:DNA processing protein
MEHGSAQAALEALPEIANKAGVPKYTTFSLQAAEREMATGRRLNARLLAYGAADYPSALKDIPDPPPLLWALGNISLATRPCIGIVGARNSSSLGSRMAKGLAKELTDAGFSVVSGLARGIDTAAHLGALEGGTIAVQAGGVDQIYPAENTQLHDDIAQQGLRISEQPLGLTPKARDFPKRNRIISGISQAIVVVEAAAKSGSLITAKNALDQGREVLAVPGHPYDGRSSGCNMLIRDGALLVRSAADILEAITPRVQLASEEPQVQKVEPRLPLDFKDTHSEILGLLGPTPVAEDQLIRDIGMPAGAIGAELTALELDGKIIRHPGGLLARAI